MRAAVRAVSLAGVTGVFMLAAAAADAGTLTLDFKDSYAPDLAPGATVLRATFEDIAADTVKLTLTDVSMTASEFLGSDGFFFNLDPLKDPTGLTIDYVSGQTAASISQFAQGTMSGANKAGPDGYFDILFGFDSAAGPGRFVAGESSVFTISMAGLTAADFGFLSFPAGALPGFLGASHVQGMAGDTRFGTVPSAWIAAVEGDPPAATHMPVPRAAWMGLVGLLAVGGFVRLRRRAGPSLDL